MRCRSLIPVLLLVFPSVATVEAQTLKESESLLTFGIIGSVESFSPKENPSIALRDVRVQRLLLDLAEWPREATALEAALQGTALSPIDLENMGLIRREGREYALNFTLLTAEDVRTVRRMAESNVPSLAAEYLKQRAEIEALLGRYNMPAVKPGELAFIVLGCFSLDWDGLDLTAEKGYRTTASVKPSGDRYSVWAEQRSDLSLQGIYWGSHNSYGESVAFTTFGDHFSLPRTAFPDLLWRMEAALGRTEAPEALQRRLGRVGGDALEKVLDQAGAVMMALHEKRRKTAELAALLGRPSEETEELLGLLMELGYVSQTGAEYALAIPVLGPRDREWVDELRGLSRGIMERWLAEHYAEIRQALAGITPLKYGVPHEEVFSQIWHYLFGTTNRLLVEQGLFADPYAPERRFKGFIPAVWSQSVYKSDEF